MCASWAGGAEIFGNTELHLLACGRSRETCVYHLLPFDKNTFFGLGNQRWTSFGALDLFGGLFSCWEELQYLAYDITLVPLLRRCKGISIYHRDQGLRSPFSLVRAEITRPSISKWPSPQSTANCSCQLSTNCCTESGGLGGGQVCKNLFANIWGIHLLSALGNVLPVTWIRG